MSIRSDEPSLLRREVAPFRTVSIMVNSACNLKCAHCDLPRRFKQYGHALSADEWVDLIATTTPDIRPEVVSVSAMEPLLPKIGQPKTAAILKAASRNGSTVGLVTNGIFAEEFFSSYGQDLSLDFLDFSVDGTPEIDARIRGPGHFAIVDRFLRTGGSKAHAKRVYISCTLTKLSAREDVLRPFLDWILDRLDEPRLVLLLLLPNQHVEPHLVLDDEDLLRVLDVLISKSSNFADIFMDVFPSSLPGFANLVKRGILPGERDVIRDRSGALWGHVAKNLFVRYENRHDLLRFNVRISPEGFALPPENLEKSDYLTGAFDNIREAGWQTVKRQILDELDNAERGSLPTFCRSQPCRILCQGENGRCVSLHGHQHLGDKKV